MHNFDMTGVDAQMKFNILWEDFWEMVFWPEPPQWLPEIYRPVHHQKDKNVGFDTLVFLSLWYTSLKTIWRLKGILRKFCWNLDKTEKSQCQGRWLSSRAANIYTLQTGRFCTTIRRFSKIFFRTWKSWFIFGELSAESGRVGSPAVDLMLVWNLTQTKIVLLIELDYNQQWQTFFALVNI